MKLIVGLGNPGTEYHNTRHNIGWRVVDAFAKKKRIKIEKHEKNAWTGQRNGVMVAKPLTYMNLSGDAVTSLRNAYADSLDDLIVVYDDIDLPLGKLRIRPTGSAGTHNGMRSIVESLGSEAFPRLRVGIRGNRSDEERLRDYVLDEFTPEEEAAVDRAVNRAVDALILFVRGDLSRAMNEFNRDDDPLPDG